MRTVKILTGLSAGILLALTGGVQAATKTDTFVVSATVNANCFIDATDLTFPGFDGSVNVLGTSNIEVRCTQRRGVQPVLERRHGRWLVRVARTLGRRRADLGLQPISQRRTHPDLG